ncbi:ABC transporter ATP-binding protein [Orrella sp. 11846]|uniref:ABC transporter ATP-binding protein n=1 Tax=Orrella sp. 11846 TaxID=3409913 RepID=UPI003B590ECB
MNMLRRYGQQLKVCRAVSFWGVLLAGAAALAEGVALAALIPLLDLMSGRSQPGVERVWAAIGWKPEGQTLLVTCLLIFLILATVAATTRALSEVLSLDVKTRVETSMRERMTDALLAMDWTAFVKLRQGDISKAMVLEGMQVGTGAMYIVSALGAGVAAACYLAISFTVSLDLTLIALGFGAVGGAIYILASRGVRHYADRLSQLVGDIGDRSTELFGNLKYFRATGQELELRQRAVDLFGTYGRLYLKSQLFAPVLRGGIEVLAAFFIAGFLFFHLGLREGSITQILIFLAIFYRMVPRLLNAQSFLFQARTYLTWLDTYDERLKTAHGAAKVIGGTEKPLFEHSIRLRDVSVTFSEKSEPVLKGINLELHKGQSIAFVGPSGGGKTTLTDMLTGLIQPSEGAVEIDGQDLRTLNQTAWREKIGLVMQEPLMLHASIATNVAMSEDIDRARVENALRAADAWEFVKQLPDGIDTLTAERGARLSGGQRQRIAIARALYRQPDLLILDEATSALDSYAEERVQTVVERMRHHMTTVIVAHRLKTVRNADLICVVANGHICESGGWEDLMERKGILYEMALRQSMDGSRNV